MRSLGEDPRRGCGGWGGLGCHTPVPRTGGVAASPPILRSGLRQDKPSSDCHCHCTIRVSSYNVLRSASAAATARLPCGHGHDDRLYRRCHYGLGPNAKRARRHARPQVRHQLPVRHGLQDFGGWRHRPTIIRTRHGHGIASSPLSSVHYRFRGNCAADHHCRLLCLLHHCAFAPSLLQDPERRKWRQPEATAQVASRGEDPDKGDVNLY